MAPIFEGASDATGLRFAIVVSRYNDFVTRPLLEAATATLERQGANADDVDVFWTPGAFEIPLLARTAARSGRYHALLCLGAVIRGETDHYDLIIREAARGIAQVALETEIPCAFEVLATSTVELAMARAGGAAGNKGEEAALSAIAAVHVLRHAREAGGR